MGSEEDTFKALRKPPLEEMIYLLRKFENETLGDYDLITIVLDFKEVREDFVKSYGWTLKEMSDAILARIEATLE